MAFAQQVGQAQEIPRVCRSQANGALNILDGIGAGEAVGFCEADAPVGGQAEGDGENYAENCFGRWTEIGLSQLSLCYVFWGGRWVKK